jgi:BNR repeat-like domain
VREPARRRAQSLLVGIGVAVLLGPSGPARASFTPEVKFSAHQHDDWEPAIAADDSGHVYWATTRYGGRKACKTCPDPAIVYRRSDDNGFTWSEPRFLCRCPGVEGQHDPVLVADDQGRVFAVWMNDWVVNFARSDDFGFTWARNGAVQGTLRYGDKPWIGASADGDDVYIHFNAPNSLGAEGSADPYAVYSHNAGETWSLPHVAAVTTRYFFADGLTVTPDGAAFAAVTAPRNDQRGDILLLLVRSLDGGRHSKTLPIARSRMQRRCPPFAGCPAVAFLGARVAVASDDDGRVYALWTANRKPAGPGLVYLRWSDDRGATWSAPRQLSGVPGRVNHEFPMIAATGDGDVRVAWMDNRTGRWNTWYRRSVDGSATWSALQHLSNRVGGAPYKSPAGFRFPYGDYGMLAIDSDGNTQATWGESRSYVGPGGSWYARGL